MQVKLQFLGTGSSMGVPLIGCMCLVCKSSFVYNKRLRSSALVTIEGKKLLLDAGPDFRTQALRYGITSLDGVLLTHPHFDHIAGVDDLKAYYYLMKKKLPCMLSKDTHAELEIRYHYLFRPLIEETSVPAQIDFHILQEDFGKKEFAGVSIEYVSFFQQQMKVTGYLFGKLAYISDIREYSSDLLEALKGIDTLVLSTIGPSASPMHLGISEAIDFAKRVGARKTYFTHISHQVEHEQVSKTLPPDIFLAYDGLEITV